MRELNTNKKLPREARDEVILQVYEEIDSRGIWIPFNELEKYCFGKINKVSKDYNPQLKTETPCLAECLFIMRHLLIYLPAASCNNIFIKLYFFDNSLCRKDQFRFLP